MAVLCVSSVFLMSSMLFLFLSPIIPNAEASCPRSCNCPNTREVHCTFRHLTSPPFNLPRDSERINLGYNSLKGVTASDFGNLLKLEMLMLHGNDIKFVGPGTFYNLRHLQILKLSYNKLKTIYQGMLEGMKGLVRLHLDHNLIDFIEPFSFNGLTSLKLLQLDGNQLRDLHPHTFVTLSFLGHFRSSGLHHLHIADNNLKYLLPGILRPLSKLESLSVHENPWICDCNLRWLLEWNKKHMGAIHCKKDSGDGVNCATCVSPQLLNNSQVFQLKSEQLDCKRPSIDSPLKTGEISHWEGTEPDLPYIKDLEPPLGHLTFTLSDSHGNVAHVACEVSRPSESTSVIWETLKNSEIIVNVTLMSHLECDIDRDELHNMWRLIAYYYESPALLERGAKHENTSKIVFQYSQAVEEDSSYFTDLKGHIMAEPSWLLQPRITLQLNRRKTTTKKLVLNFSTFLTSHKETYDKVMSSWAVIQRGIATQIKSVVQGSNVTFECNVHSSGQQHVEWMLPDLMLLENVDSENIVTEDNKLHIKNTTVSDSGLYHCLVKTEMDVDTVSFRLAVREQPKQSDLNGKRISLDSGGVLTLDCSVSSPHPSETSWYLPNSKILTTSQPKGRVSMLQNNTLVLKNVSHDDTGVYSCLAVNLYGVDMLSHLLVVTDERMGKREQVSINENESPLSETKTEHEGSGYEETEYQFPKQQKTFGKERWPGISRGGKGNRGKHSSRKVNKIVQEMGSTYRAKKVEKVNAKGPSLPPNTQTTTMTSQTNVTSVITTNTYTIDTINSTALEHESNQNQNLGSTVMKTKNHHTGYSEFPGGNNDTATLQSKSENRIEIKLRNRLSIKSNLTQIRRPPPLRRRRPPLRRIHPNRYIPDSNKNITTETSINATSWSKTKDRYHINLAPTDRNTEKYPFRSGDINSPATTNLLQSHERTKDGVHTTNAAINYTTKYVTFLNESISLISKNEYNVYSKGKHVNDTNNEHVNSKNINIKRNNHKENTLLSTSTTFCPRKNETTITMPLSATTLNTVGLTRQPSRNFQQWTSFMTSRPEIVNWSPRPTTSIHNTVNGRTIASHRTHHSSSSSDKDLLLLSRLRNRYRQSQLNSLLLKFGKLVTPKPQIIMPTPISKQTPKVDHPYKPTTPSPTPVATYTIYSTASGLKPQIVSMNTVVVSAPPETDVTLPCQATGSPKPTISWKRVSTGATIQAGIKYEESLGKFEVFQNGTFVVRSLQPEDEGQYLCSAQNIFGAAHSVVTLLVVAQTPKIVNPPSRDFSVYLGKSINLHCIALGKPKAHISWILPDRTLLQEVGTNAIGSLFANGTLNIPSVILSNQGYYKCIASNAAGEDTITYNINIISSLPTINEEAIESLAISIGTSIYANCTAMGRPQPVIKWILPDGTSLKPTQLLKQRFFVFPNGTLYIKSASVTDGGKYECTATNAVGSVKRLFLLDTKQNSYLPKKQQQQQHNVSAMYGSKIYLHCSYPATIWRLPSKTLLSHHYSPERFITAFPNGTLRIQQLTGKLAGTYMCISQKSNGEDIQYFQVEVFMKAPKIENTQVPQRSVIHGKKLQMDCLTSGVPNPEVSWSLPDGTVANSAFQSHDNRSHSHYVTFSNGTLLLKQISKKDEGDYICYAKNALGEDEMKVSVRVESPMIAFKNKVSVWAELGKQAHMKCKSHGNPPNPVTWLSPSKNVISSTSTRHQILKDGTLIIQKVTLNDEGRYTCFAQNSAINSIELDVEHREPYINGHRGAHSTHVSAVSYQTTLMDCKSEGKPEAHIIWTTSSGLSLPLPYEGGRFQVHKNGSLELRGVRKSDEGQFKCVAKNSLGEASLTVTLKVETLAEKPSFSNPNIEVYPIKSDGSVITLECIATGKPRPIFVWILPNNTQLIPGTRLNRFAHVIGSGILHITSPVTTDKGIYRCLAKNVAGQAEKRYELQTGKKPYIRGNGGPLKITFGQTLNMPCTVEGWPEASVSWTLPNGLTLVKPQITGRVLFLENNTLQVKDTATFDRGVYTCKATNTYGSSFLSYPVTVMVYPPQITTAPPSVIRVHRGSSVSLNCIAIGIPKPDISWTLPGRTTLVPNSRFIAQGGIHMTGEGSLVIQNPGLMDSGIYKCNAKNVLGTDFKATYLQVV
ncbi:LOW QUALITY PROTEIN: matrix-remodeling-associated protein 5 [Alosa alosa]|nr:LOW QUALITY PROTEIN: matrix-remodeling-associated protein 5 [Alosa alosa]